MRYFNLHVTATDSSHNRDFIVPVMNKFDLKSTFIINKNMMLDERLKSEIKDSLKFMIEAKEVCVVNVEEIDYDEFVYLSRSYELTDESQESLNNYAVSRYLEAIREIDAKDYVEHENLLH